MAFACFAPPQGEKKVRRNDSWGCHTDEEGDEEEDASDDEDEDRSLARAIDKCLNQPWRLRRKVGASFRKYSKDGTCLTVQQTDFMLADLAMRLRLPEERVFFNWQQLHERFDFTGDNNLDRYECHKLAKYVLKQRRIEIAGQSSHISVPFATLDGEGYSVVKELGRGGQGVMYLCTKHMDTTRYCIKFYDKANANASGLNELIDEYALMKTLANEYIAKTYEVFQDSHFYYLVNEPYFGGDLTKLAKRAHDQGVPMSEDWWRPIFRQCLEGLGYLHRKAIMHCDIKEPNIMIESGSSYLAPKPVLIDFGLALQFSNKGNGVSGTPGYIPSETWETGVWYPLGDMFSMGVVMFQIMIGQIPSASGSVMGVLQPSPDVNKLRQIGINPCFAWERFPQEMPQFRDLVARMLGRDRKDRPRVPQALAHEWFRSTSDADLPERTVKGLVGSGATMVADEEAIGRLCEEHNLLELRQMRADLDVQGNGGSTDLDQGGRRKLNKTLRAWLSKNKAIMKALKVPDTEELRGNARMKRCLDEAIWAKQRYSKQYIRDLFMTLDVNKDGCVSTDELSALLGSEHFECPHDDIEDLLDGMGLKEGQSVNFEEFERCVLEDGRIAHRPTVETATWKCSIM